MAEKTAKTPENNVSAVKEKIVENFTDIKTYKLLNPVKVADKTIAEINLDFSKINGRAARQISNYPDCKDAETQFNEFSKTYYSHIVAYAAGITIHELDEFGLADWTAVTMLAQSFLMNAVSKITV